MKNADKPAYPTNVDYKGRKTNYMDGGLTKREAFAIAAMQGILSNPSFHKDLQEFIRNGDDPTVIIKKKAVILADALLEELEQTKSPKP